MYVCMYVCTYLINSDRDAELCSVETFQYGSETAICPIYHHHWLTYVQHTPHARAHHSNRQTRIAISAVCRQPNGPVVEVYHHCISPTLFTEWCSGSECPVSLLPGYDIIVVSSTDKRATIYQ